MTKSSWLEKDTQNNKLLVPEKFNILVLGLGNILLGDEGVGVRAVQRLQQTFVFPDCVQVLDGGTCGMDLLPFIEDRTHIFILDAVNRDDLEPGAVFKAELNNGTSYYRKKISPHQLGISDVLALAEMNGTLPSTIILLGLKPQNIGTGLQISAEAGQGIDKLNNQLAIEFNKLGLRIERKQ